MNGLLVRVGIDHSYGHWNGPVNPESGRFVYIPIPEYFPIRPGLERSYREILPFLQNFYSDLNLVFYFPLRLMDRYMHLDPDFQELTYGDIDGPRGRKIANLRNGDLIAFYAGLRPIRKHNDRLFYALIGIYIVEEIITVSDIPEDRYRENAHTRRNIIQKSDLVVRAMKNQSGRLKKCILIGEWRNRAYRVREDLIEKWGGLSVTDGYIQRSAVPPSFLNPERFYRWLRDQKVKLVQDNN